MSVVLVAEGDAPQLPAPLSACWEAAKATGDVKTDAQKASVFHPHAGPKRFGCVGLGKRKDVDTERLRRAAAVAQAIAEDRGVRSFELLIDDAMFGKASAEEAGVAIAEGLVLGAYRYQPPKKDDPKPRKGQDCAVVLLHGDHKAFAAGFARGDPGRDGPRAGSGGGLEVPGGHGARHQGRDELAGRALGGREDGCRESVDEQRRAQTDSSSRWRAPDDALFAVSARS
jgi:hypothetical protein